ncbi:Histidine phosphatase superfamily, clade-2 [Kalmanozyma brasiliensis GHG001]|uniref:Histidine acid phosphatase n=1 Tax=Kalmanozyma brasiliensis (strain GHG001) TaxID=1365824 RepID=V5EBI9_KALBG|nr:Histidine phosphatase superfamily, clade-2 [Kalmanozyma brasiliensis GHG001]EST07776.1 Histidine phosphatase superfamily, clade-2 [Kalmanozyma brasiliensis GHG001]
MSTSTSSNAGPSSPQATTIDFASIPFTAGIPMASAIANAGAGAAGPGLGWRDPPKGLELSQVHYLVRHGERTPVRKRLTHILPERWNLCRAGREFDACVLDLTPSASNSIAPFQVGQVSPGKTATAYSSIMRMRRSVETESSISGRGQKDQEEGECMLGELTDLGRLSTLRFGRELRGLYVDRLGFLPQLLTSKDHDALYFRSTNMSRTIESLEQVIRGLHSNAPQPNTEGQFIPKVLVRNGTDENLLPNTFGCSRLGALDRAFADAAARAYNPSLEEFDSQFESVTGAKPRIDGRPRLNGILDSVKAAQAHGFPMPAALSDPRMQQKVETAVVAEWFSGYNDPDPEKRTEFRRLAMGRLVNDLATRMSSRAENGAQDPLKFAVYATHDTALAGLLNTLDCFDGRWPTFTSSMGIELFRDTSAPTTSSVFGKVQNLLGFKSAQQQHYVRVRYGDRDMKLPACAAPGKHYEGKPELCTLEAFKEIAKSLQHPKGWSWEQQCAVGQGPKSSK